MNVNERIKEIKYFFTDSVPRKNNLAKKIKLHTPNAQCQKICEFVPYKVDREMVWVSLRSCLCQFIILSMNKCELIFINETFHKADSLLN